MVCLLTQANRIWASSMLMGCIVYMNRKHKIHFLHLGRFLDLEKGSSPYRHNLIFGKRMLFYCFIFRLLLFYFLIWKQDFDIIYRQIFRFGNRILILLRPLQFNYLSYELFLEKKSCQTPKKKKKKVISGVLRTKVVLKFSVRLKKKKKKSVSFKNILCKCDLINYRKLSLLQ